MQCLDVQVFVEAYKSSTIAPKCEEIDIALKFLFERTLVPKCVPDVERSGPNWRVQVVEYYRSILVKFIWVISGIIRSFRGVVCSKSSMLLRNVSFSTNVQAVVHITGEIL